VRPTVQVAALPPLQARLLLRQAAVEVGWLQVLAHGPRRLRLAVGPPLPSPQGDMATCPWTPGDTWCQRQL